MTEPIIISLVSSGVILWMLGGTYHKSFRRHLWPVVALGLLLLGHVLWWRALLTALAMVGVNTVGYGDASAWWKRVIIFTAITIPCLLINPLVWPVVPISGALATGFFYATRKYAFVSWKLWEGGMGFLQAATLVMASLR